MILPYLKHKSMTLSGKPFDPLILDYHIKFEGFAHPEDSNFDQTFTLQIAIPQFLLSQIVASFQ
jgi:hypothetical protein